MQTWPIPLVLSALALAAAVVAPSLRRDLTPLEAAAASAPDDVGIWLRLASAYAAQGRTEEAGRAFEFARKHAPTDPGVLAWAGPTALSVAERAIVGDPTDPVQWETAASLAAAEGQVEQATIWYLEALRLEPAMGSRVVALVGVAPGDPRTQAWLDTHPPTDDEVMGDVADAYMAAGFRVEGCHWYARALRADDMDTEWLVALTDCRTVLTGDDREVARTAVAASLDAHEESSLSNPTDDEALGDWADALAFLGRMEEACATWERARALDPGDSEWTDSLTRCRQGAAASAP